MPRRKRLPKLDIPGEQLDKIILLLVSLQSRGAVKAAIVEKMGLTEAQADAAIEHARAAIVTAAEVDRDRALGESIVRLNDVYERSLRIQDCKTALAAVKELNRLQGLVATPRRPEEEPTQGELGKIIAGRLKKA